MAARRWVVRLLLVGGRHYHHDKTHVRVERGEREAREAEQQQAGEQNDDLGYSSTRSEAEMTITRENG